MSTLDRKITITEEIRTETEWDFARFEITYVDPLGNHEKKSLIEDLIKKTIDEAEKIMNS